MNSKGSDKGSIQYSIQSFLIYHDRKTVYSFFRILGDKPLFV